MICLGLGGGREWSGLSVRGVHLTTGVRLRSSNNQQHYEQYYGIVQCSVTVHPGLIFVTNITNYICGEKNCHVEKFQFSIHNLSNLWSFINFYAIFVPNPCGEKSVRRKSVWRKNDKYEVCVQPIHKHCHFWDDELGNSFDSFAM